MLTNLLLFSLLLLFSVNADDTNSTGLFPNANLTVPLFSTDTSFRQNFCDIQSQFHNGEVELRTAFEGRDLHVSLTYDPDYVFRNEDGSINLENPGLLVQLLDEIALRGKFSWRDTFVWEDYNALTEDKDWTDLLLWSVDSYDISANWWFDTRARTSRGVSFPKGWMDGSLIIVTTKDDDSVKDEFKAFSWATPFTWTVWVAIIATLIVSALISAFVEGKSRRKEGIFIPFEGSFVSTILSYLHQAFLVVCGHLDIIPNTHAGQMVSLSMSFFAMLLLSAYTANLASFLVVERASEKLAINSLNDVVQNRQSICVWGGTAVETEILREYPGASVVRKNSDQEVLTGVRDGDCNYAVLPLSNYELIRGSNEINGDCTLIRVGRNFKNYDIGMAVKSDAGTLCTSLVRDMVNVHMKDLHDEGFINELWSDLYREKHDIIDETCFDETIVSPEASSDTMNLTNLGGIFLVHGGLLVLALLVYVLERQLRRRNKLKGITSQDDILRHSQFLKRSTNHTHGVTLEDGDIHTEMSSLRNKVDGIEGKVEDSTKTMSEMLMLMKQQQQGQSPGNDPNRKVYFAQETFNTAASSIHSTPGQIQYDLGGEVEEDNETFKDDDFSYDTNAVFK
ncbi:hypothetical protein CTEN210_12104 [Chaetoceros tenuissimus]|uniref:Ionotropic glutamate receptor C-terminal domain-containing protein n=1 Tax=Chaetoceros tenuissimus TaxID=426638 RepID=A0AAD3D0J1_9STRA|nr:hypothetical protein CTEN210_12104 [Chaetoceros tenuissimus]